MSNIREKLVRRAKRLLNIQSPSPRKESNLNPRTEKTKKVMHLMVTSLCDTAAASAGSAGFLNALRTSSTIVS